MLISEIITEVIQDVGGDTSDTDLDALMLVWTKGTLRRFPMFARSRQIKTIGSVTLSSGANSASLPTDFIKESYVYRTSSGADIEIETHPHFKNVVNTSDSGIPTYYEIVGTTIYFDKNADTDYTIYIEYFKELDDIASTDTWSYDTSMLEVMKDGMKSYYYGYVEDKTMRDDSLILFKNGLDEMEAQYVVETGGKYIYES